jgi:murein DD-endopeptidase MepM/ murein hydrolase activator NlpD
MLYEFAASDTEALFSFDAADARLTAAQALVSRQINAVVPVSAAWIACQWMPVGRGARSTGKESIQRVSRMGALQTEAFYQDLTSSDTSFVATLLLAVTPTAATQRRLRLLRGRPESDETVVAPGSQACDHDHEGEGNGSFVEHHEHETAYARFAQPASGTCSGSSLGYPVDPSYRTPSSPFGARSKPTTGASSYHRGVDFPVPVGSNVYSAQDGTVIVVSMHKRPVPKSECVST